MDKKPGEMVRIVDLSEATLWLENHNLLSCDSEDFAGYLYGFLEEHGVYLHDSVCEVFWKCNHTHCTESPSKQDIDNLFEHFSADGERIFVEGN